MLRRLEAASQRYLTPCGDGHVVWRAWGAGSPLVLLHGGTGSWRHWVLNIEALAQRHLVLVPDLPGMGESSLLPSGGDIWTIAAVVANGIDALLGAGADYDLVGFSFGAVVAGHVATASPGRVRSLTFVGAGGLGLSRSPIPYVKVRDKMGATRLEAHRQNLSALMFADPARIDDLALEIQAFNSDHARVFSGDVMTPAALRDILERRNIECPLRVVYGERDAIAWPYLQEREDFFRAVRPDVDFRLIEGVGHWVTYEAAERFNSLLECLLQ